MKLHVKESVVWCVAHSILQPVFRTPAYIPHALVLYCTSILRYHFDLSILSCGSTEIPSGENQRWGSGTFPDRSDKYPTSTGGGRGAHRTQSPERLRIPYSAPTSRAMRVPRVWGCRVRSEFKNRTEQRPEAEHELEHTTHLRVVSDLECRSRRADMHHMAGSVSSQG